MHINTGKGFVEALHSNHKRQEREKAVQKRGEQC